MSFQGISVWVSSRIISENPIGFWAELPWPVPVASTWHNHQDYSQNCKNNSDGEQDVQTSNQQTSENQQDTNQ